MNYILGIDSGATATEAVIMTDFPMTKGRAVLFTGPVIKRKKYPPINFNLSGLDETVNRLKIIISNISKEVKDCKIISAAAGISGARYEKDRKQVAARLMKETGIRKIKILPDTEIALASAFEYGAMNCGILIAGTGSILYYRDSKKSLKRTGGWGRLIGDEGGGYWIGKQALMHVTKYYDRLGGKTMLAGLFNERHNIKDTTLIKKIYHEGFEISQLAKLVFLAAGKGDTISKNIINEAAGRLAEHFKPLKNKKYNIALTGSLFTEEKLLEKELVKISKTLYPGIRLVKPALSPVWGAVKIAAGK